MLELGSKVFWRVAHYKPAQFVLILTSNYLPYRPEAAASKGTCQQHLCPVKCSWDQVASEAEADIVPSMLSAEELPRRIPL